MRTRWIAAVLALLLGLAGCSASSGGDDAASRAGGDSNASVEQSDTEMEMADDGAIEGEAMEGEAAADSDSAGAGPAAAPGAAPGVAPDTVTTEDAPMMVRRVELKVLVGDVAAAATQARASISGAGGWVQSEEIVPGTEDRPGHGSMVLRVPSSDLDGIITNLSELGEVTFTRSTAEDVTAEYRDVEARVATLEAGAERLRDLIADAPSVESIASLERELTSREADLDALTARMKVLEADVSRSTITLHLAEESEDLQVLEEEDETGFLAGLRSGWEAFTSSVTVVLTAAGALLPFLVLAALIAIPVLVWRRRRTRAGLASKDDRSAAAAGDPDGSGGDRS